MDTIELEATGFPVEWVVGRQLAWKREDLDAKRGIIMRVIESQDHEYIAAVTYATNWDQERPFTWVMRSHDMHELGGLVRARAKDVLPPGAGYPATPQYADRQRKLREQLETLTLVALSDCLRQANSSVS